MTHFLLKINFLMDQELSWMVRMCHLLQSQTEGKTLSVFLASLASLALMQMALVGLH